MLPVGVASAATTVGILTDGVCIELTGPWPEFGILLGICPERIFPGILPFGDWRPGTWGPPGMAIEAGCVCGTDGGPRLPEGAVVR